MILCLSGCADVTSITANLSIVIAACRCQVYVVNEPSACQSGVDANHDRQVAVEVRLPEGASVAQLIRSLVGSGREFFVE